MFCYFLNAVKVFHFSISLTYFHCFHFLQNMRCLQVFVVNFNNFYLTEDCSFCVRRREVSAESSYAQTDFQKRLKKLAVKTFMKR